MSQNQFISTHDAPVNPETQQNKQQEEQKVKVIFDGQESQSESKYQADDLGLHHVQKVEEQTLNEIVSQQKQLKEQQVINEFGGDQDEMNKDNEQQIKELAQNDIMQQMSHEDNSMKQSKELKHPIDQNQLAKNLANLILLQQLQKTSTKTNMKETMPKDQKFYQQKADNQQQGPFMWGQQQNEGNSEQSNQKRSFSDFFINSKLAQSQQLLLPQQTKPKFKKKLLKPLNEDVDIWKDLRNSMIERSRITTQLKSSQAVEPKKPKNKVQEKEHKMFNGEKSKIEISSQKIKGKKQFLKIGRDKSKNQALQNIENMKKMIIDKVKGWKKQQKQIQQRRINKMNLQQEKERAQKVIEEQKKARIKREEKESRVKAISERLEKKIKRKILAASPLHLREQQELLKKDKSRLKKSKTEKTKLLKQQTGVRQENKEKKKELYMLDDMQKLKRRKQFEQKIKDMQVNVSFTKKIQVLIEIDKRKNPLKYQILSKKGFGDEQIYRNHQQFKLPQDPKKLGVKYLQNLRQKNKLDDLRRYMSQQSIANIKKYERNWKSPLLQKEQSIPNPQKGAVRGTGVVRPQQKGFFDDDEYLMALKKR